MLELYVCNKSKVCEKAAGCKHAKLHKKYDKCYEKCMYVKGAECTIGLSVEIGWDKNSLTTGVDCPHHLTDRENMHAGILVIKDGKKYFFRTPDYQYGKEVGTIIGDIIKAMS